MRPKAEQQKPKPEPTRSPSNLVDLNKVSLLDAALAYASAGWPVLPLMPREKVPLGLLAPRGLLNATTDPDLVGKWWTHEPEANIGLRTGEAFDVLDLDGPEARKTLATLAPGYQHIGPVASTGKGHHLLFFISGAKNAAKMADSTIDFRGQNGYIVAPPSIHPNGHRYQWMRNGEILPDPPDWLNALLFPPRREPLSTGPNPKYEAAKAHAGSLIDVMGELVHGEMQRVARGFKMRCPFHQDDTPSLVVYTDTDTFWCFGCEAWGDVLNVLNWKTTGNLR